MKGNRHRWAAAARRLVRAARPGDPGVARPERWDPTQTSAFYAWCAASGVRTRPQYLWPLLHAAHAAQAFGLGAISALEFGVAGGNGLLDMEAAAAAATELTGVEIEIVGFDSGTGMPASDDPRDAPWVLEPSYFAMDEAALRARLRSARLLLGDVAETVPRWSASGHAPVGFAAFDLDYYTSTAHALRVFESSPDRLLPRVPCYFDDLFGYGFTEFTGAHAAIAEFNGAQDDRRLGKIHGLRFELPPEEFRRGWHEKLYVLHAFDHPRYAQPEGVLDERWEEAHRLRPR